MPPANDHVQYVKEQNQRTSTQTHKTKKNQPTINKYNSGFNYTVEYSVDLTDTDYTEQINTDYTDYFVVADVEIQPKDWQAHIIAIFYDFTRKTYLNSK